MEGDARGFRVALVASELVNPGPAALDALAVLERGGLGRRSSCPRPTIPTRSPAPLLDQVAEQAEEFARHGYRLALVGSRAGLAAGARRATALSVPPAIEPDAADQLRAFLAEVAAG